ERALFELRRLGFRIDEDQAKPAPTDNALTYPKGSSATDCIGSSQGAQTVKVVRLNWLFECLELGEAVPVQDFIVYEGTVHKQVATSKGTGEDSAQTAVLKRSHSILERASLDNDSSTSPHTAAKRRSHHTPSQALPPLLQQTSSLRETLPDIPGYLHTTYSCQRPTLISPFNAEFINALAQIRTLRLLRGDQVGVRAYSSSISALASYPYKLQSPQEVARLPGCGAKIAELFHEWLQSGTTAELVEASGDDRISVLKVFYQIWGVGDSTAREFYSKGWRDLDDVIEYGWDNLSRVQQIGVKYYDQFLAKIPRKEVEQIGDVVLEHVRRLDSHFEMTLVGGYRRGKTESGDVDVVISHRNEEKTMDIIERLVILLEKSHHITHTLSLWTRNSDRGQIPLAWKGEGRGWGTGFDTLDKALVVWQDPTGSDNLHRRVDIIISPWKTVGCALLGWSGDTTFQRDLRRYCKNEKGLKFDSS
ncbi:hypothetical protein Golomagni_07080, partial [Golovinomyces magnicellulatus]